MTEAKASDNLVERLRAVAPLRKEGQSNDFALFDMANVNLQDLNALINEAATRIEKLQAALLEIATWAEAYPVEIFPEPDLEGVKQVLIANDMMREMDRMHSSWARHLVSGIGGIARAALINTHDGRDA
jgi:hypothetical protein